MIQKISCAGCSRPSFKGSQIKPEAINVGKNLIRDLAGANSTNSGEFLAAREISKFIPTLEKNPDLTGAELAAGLKAAIASLIM